ncbi:MAG: cyclopropane-fatty-acyl-phospholipid synthase family protein [Rhodovibrionaceae bacterium]|nr:cyclopropane-fatty-acyl-phospholipid synthase family protein [Rhodovibrionaceae bacterium]
MTIASTASHHRVLAEVSRPSPAERVLVALGRCMPYGQIDLEMPNGNRHRFVGAQHGPHTRLVVRDNRFLRRFLTGGANGFAEAYIDGDCDVDDLARFLTWAAMNHAAMAETLRGRALPRMVNRIWHLMRPNTRIGAKRNIAYHYDLGNAFYEAWLDPTMTYSSAVFQTPDQTLAEAQRAKYQQIAGLGGFRQGDHVLEIGCGWGGFAVHAAKELGCRVTGITISEEQFEFARRRVHEEGLAERVEIRRQDYRDISGRFDGIASIEMFEAVGERYWPDFFTTLRSNLRTGGRASLQVITIAESFFEQYRRSTDFIQRYIFPGGQLPSPAVLRNQAEAAGLRQIETESHGHSYAQTLAEWRRRFDAAWPRIQTMGFDERFRRMWTYYLAYCEAGFTTERIDVKQVAFAHA